MKVHLLYLCLLIFLIVLNGSFLLCLFNGVKMNVDAMKSQYVLFLLLGLVAGFLISYLMFNREEIDMEGAEKIALNYTSAQKSYRSLQLEAGSVPLEGGWSVSVWPKFTDNDKVVYGQTGNFFIISKYGVIVQVSGHH